MGRPAKSVHVKSGAIANDEATVRKDVEDKIRGKPARPRAPKEMSEEASAIFRLIVKELVKSGILGKLDVFVLESTAVAVARLRKINKLIDSDDKFLSDTALQNSRAKYQSDLWRGCNELCMSPQARAKIGSLAAQASKENKDPLMAVLSDDD